jgi:hypothetical protein
MRFGVEWPGLDRVAKVRDRFRVSLLPSEGDAEVERRVRILGASLEYDAERALGLDKLLLLQTLPPIREACVNMRHRR